MAVGARIGDHLARTAAGRAAALDDEEALLGANLAHSATGLAGAGASVGAGTAAGVALLAGCERLDADGLLDTGESFLEVQLQIVAKIGAPSRVLTRAARV